MTEATRWWRRRPALFRPATRVEDVASASLVTVARATTAAVALHVAATCRLRHLLVVEAAELLGVLCTCDIEACEPSTPVGRRMSVPAITIASSAPLDLALGVMRSHAIACLPVLRNGSLTGVVTRRDLRTAGHVLADPRCARCGDDHHVRTDAASGAPVCVRCLATR